MYIEINGKRITRYQIFGQKPKLWIWLIVNFLIFWASTRSFGVGFIVTLIVYIIIINIALSDMIERLLLAINDVRRLATSKEKERLIYLFEEVKAKASVSYEDAKNFNLYIQDTISINAFAIGKKSIVVTRGFMETMSDEEIQGIIAHEVAHIVNGDTQLSLLISIGTTIYMWFFVAVKLLFEIAENTSNSTESGGMLGLAAYITRLALDIAIIIFSFIGNAVLMSYSRDREYICDRYAYDLGYGEALISALYKLYDMQISDKKKLTDRMHSSHPKVAFRIEALEKNK